MGSKGNSGVILSQTWCGLAKTINEKDTMDGGDLAKALLQVSQTAYQGLSNPVEGTYSDGNQRGRHCCSGPDG